MLFYFIIDYNVRMYHGYINIFSAGRKTGVCMRIKSIRGGIAMITITNIRNINYAAHDEVWAIVRSIKNPGRMKQIPELSPSWILFKKYLSLRDSGEWNAAAFQDVYVPTFLQEIRNAAARRKLTELIELDRQGKSICLACFCPDETLCHRSIIAGILQYTGIAIHGVKEDYSQYGKIWCSIA